VLAVSLIAWAVLPSQHLARATVRLLPGEELLSISEGINETIAVIDKPGVERKLFTNGHSMSSTAASATRYMRLFSHVPLLMHGDPQRVLVICFGVGNTADAATLHPSVTRVEAADLSRNVIEHAPWFASFNHDVISNPKLEVFVNDGRHHLRMQREETYDLITLEPPPLAYAGVNALFSREFYALARSRLRPGGFMTQWLPVDQLAPRETLAAIRAFLDVFPGAVLLSGYLQQLILLGGVDGAPQLDLAHVRQRLAEHPALARDLERIQAGSLTDLAGAFVADGGALVRATRDVEPVTDDHPVMEYSQRSLLRHRTIPATIFDESGVGEWCPACLAEPTELTALPAYLGALHACYQGGAFLGHTPEGYRGLPLPRDSAGHAAIRESRYLTALFHPRTTAEGLARGSYPCALATGSRRP
jgi:spermidine synthase